MKHQPVWWLVNNFIKISVFIFLIFTLLFPLDIVWGKNESPNITGALISPTDLPQESYHVYCPLILKMLPALPATIRLSLIGDSITQGFNDIHPLWWEYLVTLLTTDGHTIITKNHAVSGQRILSDMDSQVLAAASDDADLIIIELGTNDNNTGDMQVLRAEIEENIAELRASNPHAAIYYLNILPIWGSNGVEWDKRNIRTAINAACAAQEITCWDTYSIPWITFSDTVDGVHPGVSGHQIIGSKVKHLVE
jgi:lysophospholipase L1-like esterase